MAGVDDLLGMLHSSELRPHAYKAETHVLSKATRHVMNQQCDKASMSSIHGGTLLHTMLHQPSL